MFFVSTRHKALFNGVIRQGGLRHSINTGLLAALFLLTSNSFLWSRSSPYGYRLDRRDLVIHEPEAAIVRRIFEEYLRGKSKRQIADGLSADGIKKQAGSTYWRSSDITHLLCNEKYAGDAVLQKTYTTDTLPFRSVINRGEVKRYHVQNSQQSR